MVAAAVVGAAVIGAAGTAYAGSQAASATNSATNASIAEQNSALAQQAQLSAPYRNLGQSAIPTLQGLLGISSPSPQQSGGNSTPGYDPSSGYRIGPNGVVNQMIPSSGATPSGPAAFGGGTPEQFLQNTPGYQFTLNQGLDATKNAAAASGMLLSGNTLQGLNQYAAGLADQTYQQQVGNLENVVGMGQAAAAGQAANIGNAASTISGNLINQGNTLAGIDANTVAGITKSIGNGVNNYTTLSTLNALDNQGLTYQDYAMLNSGTPATIPAGGGYTFNTGYP